ncbi:MAG: Transcription elongation factor GreA [Candidatus Moanabacter tarae]|uniref:Transcription elongation factor GreA n=1 Tax=Candidatus Moanibacter tarae TaxID=2200854 RepID=A0A2Z4ADE8_9BACT|nr:MAG: Transcription elongation factor GreA [Candidatus Moanabacter tarae]|tara:strand:+ start:2484 stop:4355 length:1872 start_codon:yes stop_codon:yes gene_type:complete
MNAESIDLLILENPKLKSARARLEAMQDESYCIHRSWGLGQIKSYDEKERKLIIDFENEKTGHAMDPVFCLSHLEVLSPNHLIVKHRTNPSEIEDLIKKKPNDVIAILLDGFPNKTAISTEIERVLMHVLGQNRYKKWWTATKKRLIKDPRFAVPEKKTGPFVLRETPVKAEEEILEQFFSIKAPKKQINLAEDLIELSLTHDDIKEQLPDILQTLTIALDETRLLSPGERLHGLWVRNDLARFISEDVESLHPTSSSILLDTENLSELVEQIPATHFNRFLDLLKRVYPERWEKVSTDLLKHSSGKFTAECVNYLIEMGKETLLEETLNRWLDEQNLKGPLLFWIIKNRNSRKYTKFLSNLISPRLFNAIFYAIDNEALQNAGTRRIPLADLLSDDKELIPELLAEATPETTSDLATSLMLNQGFEDLTKRSLLARFIRLFPNVQNILTGDDLEDIEVTDSLIVSQESLDLRKNEYEELVSNKIPENKQAIAQAREYGDIRENSEYKMAREDQDTLLARKGELETEIRLARVTDFTDAPLELVGIGNVVELLIGSTGKTVSYSILGAWDSKPEENILSYKTPIGQSLLSQKVGSTVKTVIDETEEEWTIKSISRWIDLQGKK